MQFTFDNLHKIYEIITLDFISQYPLISQLFIIRTYQDTIRLKQD